MKISRRSLLTATIGATQLALLERFGMLRDARADTPSTAPTKLLTLYVQGGWRPTYFFCPFSPAEADKVIPPPQSFEGEPSFFLADQLRDLAPGDGKYTPVRVADTWNETRAEAAKTKWGQSFETFDLARQLSVLHGIDQGTNAHGSAYIASMCGVAGSNYRSPALSCVAAEFLHRKYGDQRPLPCVVIDVRGMPEPLGLPPAASPIFVPDAASIRSMFSTDPSVGAWWKGIERNDVPVLDFAGNPALGTIPLTGIDAHALQAMRALRGKSSAGTDAMLEQLYGNTSTVSKILARDIATTLAATKGLEFADGTAADYFSFNFGANYGQRGFPPSLDMILKLLKSDLTSSIHAFLSQEYFDSHAGQQGQIGVCARQRGTLDVLGRLLGEMKRTPAPGRPGISLLDDTLVLIFSEFSRTPAVGASQAQPDSWQYGDDHHPYTSVVFAGGGVAGNRQIGSYTTDHGIGVPVDIAESDGSKTHRVPRACDAVASALRILGLGMDDFFLPGGYGEAVGLRAGS
jgi:hypothetical protein